MKQGKLVLVLAFFTLGGVLRTHLPTELAELAKAIECEPVPGFFDRPGRVDPPYIYGIRPGPRGESAAFWCAVETSPRYRLVIVENGSITDAIEWGNYPGGLSLAEVAEWDLSEFRYIEDRDQRGPQGEYTAVAPLWSEYDGAITIFYRHEGRWLFRMLD